MAMGWETAMGLAMAWDLGTDLVRVTAMGLVTVTDWETAMAMVMGSVSYIASGAPTRTLEHS